MIQKIPKRREPFRKRVFSPDEEQHIEMLFSEGTRVLDLSAASGVSPQTVYAIINRVRAARLLADCGNREASATHDAK